MKTLVSVISGVTFPEFFYIGRTKPEMNLPWEIFDEFALGTKCKPILPTIPDKTT